MTSRKRFWYRARSGRGARRHTVSDMLQRQIHHAVEGATLAHDICSGVFVGDGRREMSEIEHRGDAARAHLISRMSSLLTTPLDREDLFRASRSIDDVLDNLRDFVREIDLWSVQLPEEALDALVAITESLDHLRRSARTVHDSASRDHILLARRSANVVRSCYQHGLAEIFGQDLTMDTLKQREALRRLDVVALRLIEATDALLDGQVKRTM